MTRKQVDKLFTEKVMEYMNAGYIIHTQTFGGSDGTLRVDLINGRQFVRVYLERKYHDGKDMLYFIVGKMFLEGQSLQRDIIWKENLEIVEETIFYEVEKNKYYVSEDEYKGILELKHERLRRRSRYNGFNYSEEPLKNQERAKQIVLPFMKRQEKCKSIKLSDIRRVEKIIRSNGDVKYRIYAKGKSYWMK